MPSTWTVRVLVAVPLAIIVVLVARTYMKNRRADYWTLAEDANKPNDRDAQLRILFVGNSFIHYNGGAEKVLSLCTYSSGSSLVSNAHPTVTACASDRSSFLYVLPA